MTNQFIKINDLRVNMSLVFSYGLDQSGKTIYFEQIGEAMHGGYGLTTVSFKTKKKAKEAIEQLDSSLMRI